MRPSASPSIQPRMDGSVDTSQTYKELHIGFRAVKSQGMSHLFPILTDLRVEGREGDNPSVRALVEELRGEGQTVSTFPVEWRGKTLEQMRTALAPMLFHYRMQALLLCERTRRHVVENDELTARSIVQVAYQYRTPLKYKIMAHWAKTVLEPHLRGQLNDSLDDSRSSINMSNLSIEGPPEAVTGDMTRPFEGRRSSQASASSRPAPPMLPSRRRQSIAFDPEGSAAEFEKTLMMILGSQKRSAAGSARRAPNAAAGAPPPPLTATTLAAANSVAGVFSSAIKSSPRNAPQ